MKYLIALASLILFSHDAIALQKANERDYLDIENHLDEKRKAERIIALRRDALGKYGADKKALLSEISTQQKIRKQAAQQALWLTIRAYGIIPFADNEPLLDDGFSVLRSPEKGKFIRWLPIFDDNGRKNLQDEFGGSAGFRIVESKHAGNTASDGISRLFPSAFDSPNQLASFIIHEQMHFTQNTTTADKKTAAELEVEAYEYELKLATDPENILGFTPDQIAVQIKDITEILDGKKGAKGKKAEIGKRKLASDQRIALNGSTDPRPLPERSIVSITEDEITRLIQEAKDQIAIAQHHHDDRLKNQWIELAQRSCLAPGSVRQSDLDVLPRLHKRDPYDPVKTLTGNCYDRVYWNLYHGGTADEINRIATPIVAPNPHQRLVPRPVEAIASVTFGQILNNISEIAATACLYQGHIPPIRDFYVPRRSYALAIGDDEAAAALKARLGRCEGHVFGRIYMALRDGRGGEITEEWMVAAVASVPVAPPPPSLPTPGYGTPPQGTNPCQRGDDPFGCQPRR